MPSEALSPRTGFCRLAWCARVLLRPSSIPLFMLLYPLACASHPPAPSAYSSTRDALADLDEFGALLVKAGLPAELLPKEREVSPELARKLRMHFHLVPPSAAQYAPRLVADVLLLGVASGKESVARAELDRRVQEFQSLVVLRPDGYLASALSGREQLCVGPVEVQEGSYRAGIFEVGTFYKKDGSNDWQPIAAPVAARSQ